MGVEAFMTALDLGESQNPYFSPDQMERFINPYMDEIFEAAHELLRICGTLGSFAFGCSNAVQEDVPKENYKALVNAYREYLPAYF